MGWPMGSDEIADRLRKLADMMDALPSEVVKTELRGLAAALNRVGEQSRERQRVAADAMHKAMDEFSAKQRTARTRRQKKSDGADNLSTEIRK